MRATIPNPIKQLPWRLQWMLSTDAFKSNRIKTFGRLIFWTSRELFSEKLTFMSSSGLRMLTMRNNIGAFQEYVAGSFESGLLEFFRKNIKNGDVVCDVGGNIGSYTIEAARIVGPTGKVYSYEAHPYTYSFLVENIRHHEFCNVVATNSAVADREGTVFLSYNKGNSGSTYVDTKSNGLEVSSITLDKDFERRGIEHLDYLKIDVEGYELAVLRGAIGLISKSKNIIIQTEVDTGNLRRYDLQADEVYNFLSKMNFTPSFVAENGDTIPADMKSEMYTDVIWRRIACS